MILLGLLLAASTLGLSHDPGSWHASVEVMGGFRGVYRHYEVTSTGAALATDGSSFRIDPAALGKIDRAVTRLNVSKWRVIPLECCDRFVVSVSLERIRPDGSVERGDAQWMRDSSALEHSDAVVFADTLESALENPAHDAAAQDGVL